MLDGYSQSLIQASGQNSVSIYVHWGTTEGKKGIRDWTQWRDVDAFLNIAKQVGIYVVARPGVSVLPFGRK